MDVMEVDVEGSCCSTEDDRRSLTDLEADEIKKQQLKEK